MRVPGICPVVAILANSGCSKHSNQSLDSHSNLSYPKLFQRTCMYPARMRIGMMAASTTDSNGDPKMNATRKAAVIVMAFWYILEGDSVRCGSQKKRGEGE